MGFSHLRCVSYSLNRSWIGSDNNGYSLNIAYFSNFWKSWISFGVLAAISASSVTLSASGSGSDLDPNQVSSSSAAFAPILRCFDERCQLFQSNMNPNQRLPCHDATAKKVRVRRYADHQKGYLLWALTLGKRAHIFTSSFMRAESGDRGQEDALADPPEPNTNLIAIMFRPPSGINLI